jgi:two-component system phosphate regulon response regulator PhoB
MAAGRHIMLVQDDDGLRHVHRLNLELVGFTVSEASDGEEALRLAHQAAPDLVILDLTLRSLDGWEALGELKTDADLQAIPVVILTSSAEESEELRALERGALAFLAKPIGIEDLIAAVLRVLPAAPA